MRRRLLPMLVLGIACLLAACVAALHMVYRGNLIPGSPVPAHVAACGLTGLGLLVWFYVLIVRTDRQLRARTDALAQANATLEQRVSARTAEIARRNAEYRAMLDVAVDCVVCTDQHGRITDLNRAAEQTFQYDRDEMRDRDIGELIALHDRTDGGGGEAAAWPFASGGVRSMLGRRMNVTARRADGTRFPAELALTVVQLDGGAPGFTAYLRDITEARVAERALRASEARMRAIVRSMNELLFEFDADGRCIAVLTPEERLYGLTTAQIIGRLPHEYLGAEGGALFMSALGDVVRSRRAATVEYPLDLPAGRRWFLSRISPVIAIGHTAHDGSCERYCVLALDITERKRAEEALAESERFARSVVDALGQHIAILDERGRIIAANRAWREFAVANGCGDGSCDEGADYLGVCDAAAAACDETAAACAAGIRAVLRRERDAFDCEYPCHAPGPGGEQRWFTLRVSRFAGGGPVRVVVSHENITTRRLAEEGLRFQKALLEAQGEAGVDGILVATTDGAILWSNRRFRELWRIPQQIIDARDELAALEHVRGALAEPEQFMRRVQYLNEHPDQTSDDEIRLTDGRTLHRYGAAIKLDGRLIGRVWYFRDITEQKRAAELERERAGLKEAVAGMEQVLGVVGHELRTPLAGMRAISEFLLTDAARGTAEFDTFLAGLNDEVVRMSETVNNLLEAARLNSGKARWNFADFRVARVCDEALDCVRPLVDPSRLAVTYDAQPADLGMHGDADAVRRLIINLATNSRKHTERGRIHVAVAARSDADGDWVDVRVSDTGSGIPPEILARLGEAFALNSGVVGANYVAGTGLGVAICKAIVAAHGGSLHVESTLGQGTTVTASLRADLPAPVGPGTRAAQDRRITVRTAGVAA